MFTHARVLAGFALLNSGLVLSLSITTTETTSTTTAAATTSTTAPTTAPTSSAFTYVGCQTDALTPRALSGAFYTDPDGMSVEECASLCNLWPYFGVEYGDECWCGSTIDPSSTPAPSSDCSFSCPGNPSESCGAGERIDIYTNSLYIQPEVATLPGYESMGCYSDNVGNRALQGGFFDAGDMTVDICAAFCVGQPYFGVEYGSQCFCGSELVDTVPEAITDCNMLCAGNVGEFCGAGDRLNVYAIATATSTTAAASSTTTAAASSTTTPAASSTTAAASSTTTAAASSTTTAAASSTTTAAASSATAAASSSTTAAASSTTTAAASSTTAAASSSTTAAASSTTTAAVSSTKTAAASSTTTAAASSTTTAAASSTTTAAASSTTAAASSTTTAAASSTTTAAASSTTTSSPAPTGPPAGWTSLGCYSDSVAARVLPAAFEQSDSMTYATCADFCSGYEYFGVEYSTQCFCGNFFANPTYTVDPTACNMPCSGDETEMCGGGDLLTVYKAATVTPPTIPTVAQYLYQGCFQDSMARVLDAKLMQAWPDMSIENCAAFCEGYEFFGAEYGQECYCGNTFANPTNMLMESNCDTVCDDDETELCGGNWALSIYQLESNGKKQ